MKTKGGEEVRLSVPIPRDLHNKLEILIPWGLKAPVVRMLLQLLVDAQRGGDNYIVTDLVEGRCHLARGNPNCSNFERNGEPTPLDEDGTPTTVDYDNDCAP